MCAQPTLNSFLITLDGQVLIKSCHLLVSNRLSSISIDSKKRTSNTCPAVAFFAKADPTSNTCPAIAFFAKADPISKCAISLSYSVFPSFQLRAKSQHFDVQCSMFDVGRSFVSALFTGHRLPLTFSRSYLLRFWCSGLCSSDLPTALVSGCRLRVCLPSSDLHPPSSVVLRFWRSEAWVP